MIYLVQDAVLKVVGNGHDAVFSVKKSTVPISVRVATGIPKLGKEGTVRSASGYPYVYGDELLVGLTLMRVLKIGAPAPGKRIPVFRVSVPHM